ncbi:10939_t:CDS:2 [Funneliformis caledonium]|uniref:10939_t:CDS:1 n=1 Tax=Funneliformis caledonium TaxID=1117310 RepID=A0A9N9DUV3_9GLOM|nr:10939_t:CDS:2 [Funneliformis caledonium]
MQNNNHSTLCYKAEHIEALKIVWRRWLNSLKSLNIRLFQRDLAEVNLRQALQSVSSENDKLSSKAQQWLHDFDIMTRSLNVERYWNAVQTNEEREITRTMKAIYSEKEEQHVFRVKSNIVIEHDVASDSLQTNIQERLGKRPSSSHILDSNKKMKSSCKTPTIDVVYDDHETSSSDYSFTDAEQEKSTDETVPMNLEKFEAYLELDSNQMWTLKSGRKVEKVIYEFARNLSRESYLHS